MNLPNFEGVLQKKAGVYTKNFQVRGGQGPCWSPPCLRHCGQHVPSEWTVLVPPRKSRKKKKNHIYKMQKNWKNICNIAMGCIYNSKKVQLKTQSTFRETKKINLCCE
jgi:hypothetical protein